MTSTADPDLITRVKEGDRSSFDELIGPLADQGFRLAYGMLHDREAAEDAVQEAAVRSWRKLGNVRPGSEMRPWFLAIVANQSRTTVRGRWWSVLRIEPRVGTAVHQPRPVVTAGPGPAVGLHDIRCCGQPLRQRPLALPRHRQ